MPVEARGQGDVLVRGIRQDVSNPSSRPLALFVVADQLLKGTALNAVEGVYWSPEAMGLPGRRRRDGPHRFRMRIP